jgi:mannose-6-phosphate isomerase
MNSISILKNKVQAYTWGSYTAIPELLGTDSPFSTPQAELWMGSHPKAPSLVDCAGKWVSLEKLIQKNPQAILGKAVASKFGGKLPYLFKVLAAAQPLSIQAHPSPIQAKQGFERENRLKIPLDAFHRNYKDENHKPECICAMTHFWAMKGFRNIPEMLSLMAIVRPIDLSKELDNLKQRPSPQGLKSFFQAIMNMDRKRQKKIVNNAVAMAKKHVEDDYVFQWMIDLNKKYPSDIGVLSPILLNLVYLEPGQAMFLPAGELHAYLDGVGIELMANSDNVLRGGLTKKHVDVEELLNVLNFNEGETEVLPVTQINHCERIYESRAEEFVLSAINLQAGTTYHSPAKRSVEILLCMDGNAMISDLESRMKIDLPKGRSVLIPAVVKKYRIKGDATIYKASVPI